MPKILGVNIALTHSSPQHPLGTVFDDGEGNRYQYIRADDAVLIHGAVTRDYAAAGSGVAGDVPNLVTSTTNLADPVLGIPQIALAAGDYAFVLIEGAGIAVGDGSVAQGDVCMASAADGVLDTQTSTAVNPTTVDFDSLVARGRTVVATSADSGTPAVFNCVIF